MKGRSGTRTLHRRGGSTILSALRRTDPMNTGTAPRSRPGPLAIAALCAGASLAGGCGLLRATADAPGKITKAVLPGSDEKEAQVTDPAEQQAELMRLTESSQQSIVSAIDAYAAEAEDADARLLAARWKLMATQRLFDIGSRPDTIPALLDLIVLMRLGRTGVERRVESDAMGEAGRPILEAVDLVHTRAWDLAARLLDADQLARARKAIDAWAEQLGEVDDDAVLTPPSIEEIAKTGGAQAEGGGLAGLLTLDPLAGLEPTTREIALARLFAERALFVGKHAPEIVRAQLELALLQVRRQPETAQLLENVDGFGEAARALADVSDELPDLVRSEREAAIAQVFDELDAHAAGLVAELEAASEPVTGVLDSSRAALAAAEQASARLDELVASVDAFVARWDRPEDAPPEEEEGPPARPFDITEYGDAVTRLGETARELTTLVNELDASVPELQRLVDNAAARGEGAVDHAFARGLVLGLALIAAAAAAAIAVRRVPSRRAG